MFVEPSPMARKINERCSDPVYISAEHLKCILDCSPSHAPLRKKDGPTSRTPYEIPAYICICRTSFQIFINNPPRPFPQVICMNGEHQTSEYYTLFLNNNTAFQSILVLTTISHQIATCEARITSSLSRSTTKSIGHVASLLIQKPS